MPSLFPASLQAQQSSRGQRPGSQPQITLPSGSLLEQAQILEQRNIELLGTGAVDPESYVLGPGDLLGLEIIGAFSLSDEDLVSADGSVTFQQLGTIAVAGMTLAQARETIAGRSAKVVRGTDVHIVLKSTRAFKVFVTGRVKVPGAFRASATMRVSELISAAGGVLPGASLRRVRVTAPGGEPVYADLMPFLTQGDTAGNPYLVDGAVVVVEAKGDPVTFAGAFRYPGEYDFLPGDTLDDLLQWVGWAPQADKSSLLIQRFQNYSDWDTLRVGEGADVALQPRDRVLAAFTSPPKLEAPVTVLGAVLNPGPVPVKRNTVRVMDVINMAGGPREGAVLERAVLARPFTPDSIRVSDPTSRRSVAENLNTYRFLDTTVDLTASAGPLVEPGDVISLPLGTGFVQILGQVKRPGFYDYHAGWSPMSTLKRPEDGPNKLTRVKPESPAGVTARPCSPRTWRSWPPGI